MRWVVVALRIGKMSAYILVRKSEYKRPLGRYWNRCEDNIEVDHNEIGSEGVD
jgi:hypothetical protein